MWHAEGIVSWLKKRAFVRSHYSINTQERVCASIARFERKNPATPGAITIIKAELPFSHREIVNAKLSKCARQQKKDASCVSGNNNKKKNNKKKKRR